jgi:4-hydroxy-tetrahydrodipicolinate reductase
MGRMIERIAPSAARGYLKLDEFNNANFEGITSGEFRGIDVAIDFSIPSAAVANIERIASLGVNLVVGTTGWQDHAEHVKDVVEKAGNRLVWSPNYSVGVNAFFRIVARRRSCFRASRSTKRGRGKFIIRPRKTRLRNAAEAGG